MTAPEFTVRENDVAREVIRVSPAPPPSHVYFLVDDSQATQTLVQYLRPAMATFIAKMAALTPAPQQALMTFGERPDRRVDFTPNPESAARGVETHLPHHRIGCRTSCRRSPTPRGPEEAEGALTGHRGVRVRGRTGVLERAALADRGCAARRRRVAVGRRRCSRGRSPCRRRGPRARVRARRREPRQRRHEQGRAVGQGIESGVHTSSPTLLTSRYLVTYGRPDSPDPARQDRSDVPPARTCACARRSGRADEPDARPRPMASIAAPRGGDGGRRSPDSRSFAAAPTSCC